VTAGAILGMSAMSEVDVLMKQVCCRSPKQHRVVDQNSRVISLYVPAAVQLGLFEVHRRVIEGEEPIPAAPGQPQGILTRMLVCHSQAGSIIGK
jgi:hypothetical protein